MIFSGFGAMCGRRLLSRFRNMTFKMSACRTSRCYIDLFRYFFLPFSSIHSLQSMSVSSDSISQDFNSFQYWFLVSNYCPEKYNQMNWKSDYFWRNQLSYYQLEDLTCKCFFIGKASLFDSALWLGASIWKWNEELRTTEGIRMIPRNNDLYTS